MRRVALALLCLSCEVGPREHHVSCPRCETAAERAALVDCLAKFRVVPPEDDEYGTTVREVKDSCTEAVCPRRPTVCAGYAICGQSYCHPEKATP
jgi:hypothetical protein